MTENTINALKVYKTILSKNKIEEGKSYKVDYELKSFTGEAFKAYLVKATIFIDNFEIAPMILFEFFGGENKSGIISFADPKLVIDHYDKDAIRSSFDELIESEQYDISLIKDAIKKINLKEA